MDASTVDQRGIVGIGVPQSVDEVEISPRCKDAALTGIELPERTAVGLEEWKVSEKRDARVDISGGRKHVEVEAVSIERQVLAVARGRRRDPHCRGGPGSGCRQSMPHLHVASDL